MSYLSLLSQKKKKNKCHASISLPTVRQNYKLRKKTKMPLNLYKCRWNLASSDLYKKPSE